MIKETNKTEFMFTDSENNKLFKKYLEGKISSEEINIISSENSKLLNILDKSGKINVAENKSEDEIWNEISVRIKRESQQKHSISPLVRYSISIAASILLAIGILFIFQTKDSKIFAESGKQFTVNLPDGSEVILNAESEISYNKKNWDNNRTLKLKGEAYFKVKKGSKFTVETEKGNIQVLGTSFNIFSRNGKLEVKCFTGKVKVYNNTQNQIITPGEEIKLEQNSNLKKFQFENKQIAEWTKGEFYFDSADLKTVFDEIQRQFNVKITLPEISGRKYTGFFNNKNLEQALQNVCIPMKLSFTIKNNKVEVNENFNY
jgi:ferric-dicitrate binding protein FerR (iron transport regulator)